jgi:AcrR family transcriptional regulator
MAGLRERKKQATRLAIHEAAMRLFAERGFTATTIDQIAAASDVSRATVLNYFATKEDIVYGDASAAFAFLERALDERPAGQGVATAFRAWLVGVAELGGWFEPELALQLRLAEEVPTVGAARLALHREIERILADALADEVGRVLPARLAAASLVAAVRIAEETAVERMNDAGSALSPAEIDALIAEAVTFAAAGAAAIRG